MTSRVRDRLGLLARLALAPTLLYAGAQKVGDPSGFATVIGRYHLLPEGLDYLVALYIPWLEIVLGVSLALGVFTRASGLLSSLLCGGFAVAVSSAVVRGIDIECGCFSGSSKVSWTHVVVDLILLAASIVACWHGGRRWSLDALFASKHAEESPIPSNKLLFSLTTLGLALTLALGWRNGVTSGPPRDGTEPPITAQPSPATALLEFSSNLLNLGTVPSGQTLEGQVEYKNVSARPLHIIRSEASCGCTEGVFRKPFLQPGESGTLKVGFDSRARQGSMKVTVRLYIEGIEAPVTLDVEAEVSPAFTLEPAIIFPAAGEKTGVRMASSPPGQAFKVVEFKSPPALGLELKVLNYPSPGVANLEVTAKSHIPSPVAPSEAWPVSIKTDLPDLPTVNLYVAPPESK